MNPVKRQTSRIAFPLAMRRPRRFEKRQFSRPSYDGTLSPQWNDMVGEYAIR